MAAGETGLPRRLYAYNAGFLREQRLRRIVTLAGHQIRAGLPGPSDGVVVWGRSPVAWRGEAVARRCGVPLVRLEDAFLRSVRPGRAGDATIGLMIDGTGVHFDSAVPSALERLLAAHPLDDPTLLDRATLGMARMRALHLSKYNMHDPDLAPPPPGYVLVVDQTAGDASIRAGGATAGTFATMLAAAKADHPGVRIVIRTHPETAMGLRLGHFGLADTDARTTLVSAPVSPARLIAGAAAVFTVSSLMGFEAVMTGHRPRVFGKPFYAGWGLSDDAAPVPRRIRRLTPTQMFAAAMILAPTWYDPCRDRLCRFEDAVDQMEAEVRAFRQDRAGHVASGMRLWKRSRLQAVFGAQRPLVFADPPARALVLAQASGRSVLIWAGKVPEGFGAAPQGHEDDGHDAGPPPSCPGADRLAPPSERRGEAAAGMDDDRAAPRVAIPDDLAVAEADFASGVTDLRREPHARAEEEVGITDTGPASAPHELRTAPHVGSGLIAPVLGFDPSRHAGSIAVAANAPCPDSQTVPHGIRAVLRRLRQVILQGRRGTMIAPDAYDLPAMLLPVAKAAGGMVHPDVPRAPIILRVEDGFVRSRGLGARLVPPLSLVADDLGIYYDPGCESRLERLIAGPLPPGGAARAQRLMASLIAANLSKYNLSGRPAPDLPSGHRILVPGQVEDDASLRAGCAAGDGAVRTNLGLLRAVRADNPGAVVIWKPHPDVEAGLRKGAVPVAALKGLADVVAAEADPIALIAACDEVWTMTSLLGFEALIRGRAVTCLGMPFYAGWGLTRDLMTAPARRAAAPRPDIAHLAHAALIAYPRCFDPVSRRPCPPEVVVERLASGALTAQGLPLRWLAKAQGRIAGFAYLWR